MVEEDDLQKNASMIAERKDEKKRLAALSRQAEEAERKDAEQHAEENLFANADWAMKVDAVTDDSRELMELQMKVLELHELFFYIGSLVDREADMLHEIEDAVDAQEDYTGAAIHELESARDYQASYEAKRQLVGGLFWVVVFIVVVGVVGFVIFYFVMIKPKAPVTHSSGSSEDHSSSSVQKPGRRTIKHAGSSNRSSSVELTPNTLEERAEVGAGARTTATSVWNNLPASLDLPLLAQRLFGGGAAEEDAVGGGTSSIGETTNIELGAAPSGGERSTDHSPLVEQLLGRRRAGEPAGGGVRREHPPSGGRGFVDGDNAPQEELLLAHENPGHDDALRMIDKERIGGQAGSSLEIAGDGVVGTEPGAVRESRPLLPHAILPTERRDPGKYRMRKEWSSGSVQGAVIPGVRGEVRGEERRGSAEASFTEEQSFVEGGVRGKESGEERRGSFTEEQSFAEGGVRSKGDGLVWLIR